MWKPEESLDDYVVNSTPGVTSKPPRDVSLWRTGEVEVLKPLAPAALRPAALQQPLWFRRFLAIGSGALVTTAFVLVSAIFVGISDPGVGPDVATNATPDAELVQPEEPFDIFSPSNYAPVTLLNIVRSNVRRRQARPEVRVVVAKRRPQLRPLPQPEEPKFMPTTLVIFPENGVINTRIEPWLQASYKKPPGLITY